MVGARYASWTNTKAQSSAHSCRLNCFLLWWLLMKRLLCFEHPSQVQFTSVQQAHGPLRPWSAPCGNISSCKGYGDSNYLSRLIGIQLQAGTQRSSRRDFQLPSEASFSHFAGNQEADSPAQHRVDFVTKEVSATGHQAVHNPMWDRNKQKEIRTEALLQQIRPMAHLLLYLVSSPHRPGAMIQLLLLILH